MNDEPEKLTVAIAGATGFVGKALREALRDRYRVIGLTRSPTRAALEDDEGVQWRHCDLFSVSAVQRALRGVDVGIYLVHSMLPSARLTQADFADLDLLLADNFARAAERNGLAQIIYLGGILPARDVPSKHLESRLEVEQTLGARRTPVTALRAGLVVGPGGSSSSMLINLVRRLPAMVLPAWTRGESAPIAIRDVVRAIQRCLGRESTFGRSFDIGGPERMTYRRMLERTAAHMGARRPMIDFPLVTPGLSRLWITMITSAPRQLVGPLIESLRHSLVPEDNELQRWLQEDALTLEASLTLALDEQNQPQPSPREVIAPRDARHLEALRTVRSVQRMPLPAGRRAQWVATEYMRWLPEFVWPFLVCRVEAGVVRFFLRFTPLCLLELTHAEARSEPDRQLLWITGGVLARVEPDKSRGRFELREVLDGQHLLTAIHDFRPALPWALYAASQAVVHLWVMNGFRRHLAGLQPAPRGHAADASPR